MNVSTFLFMNQFNERHECQGSFVDCCKKALENESLSKIKAQWSPTSTLSTCNVKLVVDGALLSKASFHEFLKNLRSFCHYLSWYWCDFDKRFPFLIDFYCLRKTIGIGNWNQLYDLYKNPNQFCSDKEKIWINGLVHLDCFYKSKNLEN